MELEAARAECARIVRARDPDRYFASLFAPAAMRPHLFAVYAFHNELERIAGIVREPMMGEIRLAWWRETLDAIYGGGGVRAHPVALALADTLAARDVPRALVGPLIDSQGFGLSGEILADVAALEAYAGATAGGIMRLAAFVLGAGLGSAEPLGHAGIAHGLAGVLRTVPQCAARGSILLPAALLAEHGAEPHAILAGRPGLGLASAMRAIAAVAASHLDSARAARTEPAALPALLPAALVPLYARIVARPDFEPFRDPVERPLFLKQFALARAAWRGRI